MREFFSACTFSSLWKCQGQSWHGFSSLPFPDRRTNLLFLAGCSRNSMLILLKWLIDGMVLFAIEYLSTKIKVDMRVETPTMGKQEVYSRSNIWKKKNRKEEEEISIYAFSLAFCDIGKWLKRVVCRILTHGDQRIPRLSNNWKVDLHASEFENHERNLQLHHIYIPSPILLENHHILHI